MLNLRRIEKIKEMNELRKRIQRSNNMEMFGRTFLVLVEMLFPSK